MKKIYSLIIILILAACNADPKPNPEELKEKLKSVMTDYLYKDKNYDSANVHYHIENVIYFDDKTWYICEFKVRMALKGQKDTVGVMKAFISNDFSKVTRNY